MIDLLVISQSCLTGVNRAPYRELARRGWSVELVIPDRYLESGFDRSADPRGSGDPPIHPLPLTSSHPRLWTFRGLARVLDARRPRVILVDVDAASRLALELGWWARRNNAHVACLTGDNIDRSVAGEFRRSPAAGLRLFLSRSLVLLARHLVDHVFVLSSDSARLMVRLGFHGRTSLIPLGFDPNVFRPDPVARARVREQLGLHALTFAYFGRVVPEKGIHLLLQALHGLRELRWHLLLDEFGEYGHPYATELRRLITELSLEDRVVFFDAPHAEVADYMNAADVVVVASICSATFREQYGRVIPEAMACGRTVIVSTCGALPEVAGPSALVVRDNDVGALRDALRTVLGDVEKAQSVSSAAVAHAMENHSLAVQCDRLEATFRGWVA